MQINLAKNELCGVVVQEFDSGRSSSYSIEGIKAVAAAIAASRLTSIDLSSNTINDEGGAAIAEAISASRSSLTSIDLRHNIIDGPGALRLAAVVIDRPKLESF